MQRAYFAVLLFLLPLSCGSKGAVAITAAIHSPAISVGASSGLGAELTGSFSLHLELGQVASSGTDVSIGQGNFSLVDPASQATLVVLKFTASPAAPYHLDPGGKLDIAMTVSDKPGTPGQLITKDEQSAICSAKDALQIAGSISESSGSTPVSSLTFAVTGCP
jgi:hypothetical protein